MAVSMHIKHNLEAEITSYVKGKLGSGEMQKKVILPVNEEIKKQILENTRSGMDITGEAYEPLSPTYARRKKSGKADLRYEDLSLETLYGTAPDNKTGYMSFEQDADMLWFHQKGASNRPGAGRLPQRKIFPEPEDQEKGDMKTIIRLAENILEKYMNE